MLLDRGGDSLPAGFDCLRGGGEMGAMMRAFDWASSALGPVSGWPQSLRTSVSICLNSQFAILLWWGPDLIMLYNDAYRQVIGGKHPAALGHPGRECWREIWDIVGPMLGSVLETGNATWSDDLLLLLERNGYPEECYFTFSYSPIRAEDGTVGGVFTPVKETTEKVIGERRLETLRALASRGTECRSAEDALRLAAETLAGNPYDLPFAMLYALDEDERARLAGCAGVDAGSPVAPLTLRPESCAWPFQEAVEANRPVVVENLENRFGILPRGARAVSPQQALVLPITPAGQERPAAMLIAGVNPHKALGSKHDTFYELVASHLAGLLADGMAYEQERKRAEALAELDRAKSTFFSNVSHEFRTPLTLILGPVEDMLAVSTGVDRQNLEMVYRNTLRLQKLVNALLDFSRIEAGRIRAARAPLDLARFTAEIASAFHSTVESAGIRFVVDCPETGEPADVDPDLWEKIVLNLLSNALKFTAAGEIGISLRQAGGDIELRVWDTGEGIPTTEQPRIFERFYRVRSARGRTHEGSGVGLAIVHEYVKLHDGTVSVESEPGRGSMFVVRLPVQAAQITAARAAQAEPRPAAARAFVDEAARWESPAREAARKGARRVLIADDNADMRDYMVRLLSPEYHVRAVENGALAMEQVREWRPDLVLSDVMMPEMDGFELLRAIRSDVRARQTPVVLVSARAGEESRIEGLDSGADDYLVKPFSARELVARVRTHLAMAELRDQAAAAERSAREQADQQRRRTVELLDSLDEGFISFDAQWRYTFVNRKGVELSGRPADQLVGRVVWDVFPEMIGTEFYRRLHEVARTRKPAHFSDYYPEAERWFEANAYPSDGGVSVVVRDASDRIRAERRAAEHLRQLHAVYATADAVSRAHALEDVYQEALAGLMRAIGADRLSVLVFDPDGVMRFKAWSGISAGYRAAVEGHTPWKRGEKTARSITVADVRQDISLTELAPVFAREGIRALAFVPLLGQEGVLGKFMVYYSEPHVFSEAEIHVAETIASHVAFATERTLAEAALRQAKTRMQDILDSITESLIAVDKDFRFTYASKRVVEATGRSYQEILGASLWDLFPHALETEFRPQYERVMRERVPAHFAVHYEDRWLEVYAHPTPEGISAYILNVTEQRRSQEALRESEEKYRFLTQALPQFVWTAGADGRTQFLNQFWYRYTGMPAGADIAEYWPRLVHPEDFERAVSAWQGALAAGQAYELEYRIFSAEASEYRWILARHQPLLDPAGAITGWVATAIDIDDRKRAEQALRDSEKRAHQQFLELDTLYESAPAGMCLLDTDLRFVRLNEKLAALEGIPVSQHLGRTIDEVLPSAAPVLCPLFRRALDERRAISHVEVQIDSPQGGPSRYWLLSLCPLETGGELLGVSAVIQDLSEHKRFELQLRETQKLEAIGVLAGGVAHDFNNLLTGILGNASVALEMVPDSALVVPVLNDLIAASEKAADLTRQLLAYAGKGRFVVRLLDVSAVVREISTLVRTSTPRSVELVLKLADGLPLVQGDATQLQQLVMNLIINAAEAIEPGKRGFIRVSTGAAEGGVFISVRDNGRGMDEATRARIFDPFFTTKFTGRGLGLAAALGIVRGHNGTVEVHSAPGAGSEFLITLPASAGAQIAPPAPKADEAPAAARFRVLVVDDEDVVRRTAKTALQRYGHDVVLAVNGREGLERFQRDSFDLVLLDLTMPVMDGARALAELRHIDPEVCVILMSGYNENEAARHLDGVQPNAFVQKPFSPRGLAGIIDSVLARRAGASGAK